MEAYDIDTIDRLAGKLSAALEKLEEAADFAKAPYQTDVFQLAETLMQSDAGMQAVYSLAHRFDECGLFHAGPWAKLEALQPPLVAGSLNAGGVYPVVETLSELRVLAIAKGRCGSTEQQAFANQFLNELMALSLPFLFPAETEEERINSGPHREMATRLFTLLATELDLSTLKRNVVAEIEQVCAQRPIVSKRVVAMIHMAKRIEQPDDEQDVAVTKRLEEFTNALDGPSPLSRESLGLASYREALRACSAEELRSEAEAFAKSMHSTGLVCPHHAVLLRHLSRREPDLVPEALDINDSGRAELAQQHEFAMQLIRVAITPSTCQCIYGFAKLLERGLLSRKEVKAGLSRVVDIDLQTDVRRRLLDQRANRDGVTANAVLLAGIISVLGQPLGVGQGANPTCQAARAISLWAQHAHGYLLKLIISAARDGFIEMVFEGEALRSSQLDGGVSARIDYDLDPVSIIVVPHLDKLYDAMMKRVVLRQEDGHKWVNPALYGRWVPRGFASVFFDRAQRQVSDYGDFVRRFFATHHPSFNEGHTLMYPNPVGLLVTNGHGDYLGPHAVSLQRVAEDEQGELRAYFYNPNNEGRQDWGFGVKPTISGHLEKEGESSLPFHHFASRLYAFHYNPYEEGDAFAVPHPIIEEIEEAARKSWGKTFTWLKQ